jgi:hypothetical protein
MRRASSTDHATWGTFDDAVEAYGSLLTCPDRRRGPVAGIGCVLTPDAASSASIWTGSSHPTADLTRGRKRSSSAVRILLTTFIEEMAASKQKGEP